MANSYMEIPISITVEGANTLMRSLIIFGQGLTRSHPHLLDILKAIQHGDDQKVSKRAVPKEVGGRGRGARSGPYSIVSS